MKNKNVLKLTYSGVCLALCMVLPLLTGQIPEIGSKLLPMHIPVLLCGFLCGPLWGLGVGLVAPILRSLIFGMPPLFPTALAMAFELAAYGCFAGLFYKLLPKKLPFLYVALILAMILGRVVWGLAMYVLTGISGKGFTMTAFLTGAFINAWPGILLQLVLIPPAVIALRKAKLMLNE